MARDERTASDYQLTTPGELRHDLACRGDEGLRGHRTVSVATASSAARLGVGFDKNRFLSPSDVLECGIANLVGQSPPPPTKGPPMLPLARLQKTVASHL